MAEQRIDPDSSSPQPPAQPRARVTGLGWGLIAACPLLAAILFLVGRGPVAVAAFLLLALDLAILAAAVIAPPRRPRRRPPWSP